MSTTTHTFPDLSVDFLTWINAELRKRIEEPEEFEGDESDHVGFVNRLKAYFTGA